MTLPIETSAQSIMMGSYECAAIHRNRPTNGVPARRAIMKQSEVEKYNVNMANKCTSAVSTVPMSMSELTFHDRNPHLDPRSTRSHQFLLMKQQQRLVQKYVSGRPCHIQSGYDFSNSEITVSPHSHVGVVTLTLHGSIVDNAQLQWSTPPEKAYVNNKAAIHNMADALGSCTTNYKERTTSKHRTGGTSTNDANAPSLKCAGKMDCSNTPVLLTASYEMGHCTRTSPDIPPVLQLHKQPVVVTFPYYMICAISPRYTRSEI